MPPAETTPGKERLFAFLYEYTKRVLASSTKMLDQVKATEGFAKRAIKASEVLRVSDILKASVVGELARPLLTTVSLSLSHIRKPFAVRLMGLAADFSKHISGLEAIVQTLVIGTPHFDLTRRSPTYYRSLTRGLLLF